MAGPGTGMGISLTTITTDLQAPLGFIHTEPASVDGHGERTFIYIRYVATAAPVNLVIGQVMGLVAGEVGYNNVVLSTLPDPGTVVGVSQQVWTWTDHYPSGPGAADALFGFVQRTGLGDVFQLGGVVADVGIISGGAGDATTSGAATNSSFGTAHTSGAGTEPCTLACKG